ncbi:unnamed protein product [Gongylonema pulchrum]|uniref:Pentatricopeptide repeat-containing protein n=1 Tax=Gongylonema pulchrum TaxID=637853 RepID=A0A183DIZ2_9BILA|nr:unnamed protein product [Gongylonema pulchrum]
MEPLIVKARCRTALERGDIEEFKCILNSVLSSGPTTSGFTNEFVLELVWLLARKSADPLGKEHHRLCSEILGRVKKEHGFLKLMVREADRHAAHGLFYSALSYFHIDLHKSSVSNSHNDKTRGLSSFDICFFVFNQKSFSMGTALLSTA